MKKSLLCVTAVLAVGVCGGALAAPLTEYKPGKIAVQVGVNTLNDIKSVLKNSPGSQMKNSFKDHEKTKPYAGVTLGIAKNWALQYRYEQLKSNPEIDNTANVYTKIDTQEYNLRYALDSKISAYVGDCHVKFSGGKDNAGGFEGKTRDLPHVGLTGVLPFGGSLCAWADVGAGKDIYHYEAGVGYKFSKNLCLDLSYKYLRVDKMGEYVADYMTKAKIDGKTRGIRVGVTYTF